MPRPKPAPHPSVGQAVESLVLAIGGLVSTVASAVHSARDVGSAATDVRVAVKKGRGPGKNNPKLKSALKRSWAAYTPAQRKARIKAMLKGRGLKPKAKRAVARKPTAARTAKPRAKGAWASMSPEQRAERIAKMRAGRGRQPKGQKAAGTKRVP